jgi:DNA-binding response OmpR family regulator/Tfp pilus assembly protein PilF
MTGSDLQVNALSVTHHLPIAPRFGTRTRALVVDSHATTRNILATHLRALGVAQVVQCVRAHEALRQIEACGFDLILCENRLADGTLAQDLIEELRRSSLLSLRTVVMVISAEASYNTVAEVAETALDGFVVRPYTPGGLEDRLLRAYRRKEALAGIFDAMEAQRFEEALGLCESHFARRAAHWSYAARLGAELALRLDRVALASSLYEAVLAVKAVPWARLGIARTLEAAGATAEAVSTIESLLATEPRYVDAYDVLGKVHAESGNLGAALKAYRQASEITPASVQRAQKYGIVAFYAGTHDVAMEALQRAAQIGAQSRHFDPQTLLLLALLHYRQSNAEGLAQCRAMLGAALADPAMALLPDAAAARRLHRLGLTAQALELTLQGQADAARQLAATLAAGLEQPEFDIEAAANLLALMAALCQAGVALDDDAAWLRSAGLRFCVSRHATEVMAKACEGQPDYAQALRQAHADIGETAQAALGQVLAGDPRRAVEQLLDGTEKTRNAKLLHSAIATMQRYRERIGGLQPLQQRCAALQALWGAGVRSSVLAVGPEGEPRPGVARGAAGAAAATA